MGGVPAGHGRSQRLRRLNLPPRLVFGVDLQDALIQLGLDTGGEVQPHFVTAEPCPAPFEVGVGSRRGTQPFAVVLEPDPGFRVDERDHDASWRCAVLPALPAVLRSRLPEEEPGPQKQAAFYGMYGRWIVQMVTDVASDTSIHSDPSACVNRSVSRSVNSTYDGAARSEEHTSELQSLR